jgi:hypothetical protein
MKTSEVEEVLAWLEGFLSESPAQGARPEVRPALQPSHERELATSSVKAVREEIWKALSSGGGWEGKGIYVWYWAPTANWPAWPLYVGKSQRGHSSFASRAKDHLRFAANGTDFLYDPAKSRSMGRLVDLHRPVRKGTTASHAAFFLKQFVGMKVLLLPMDDGETADATRLAGIAEAIVLQAVLHIHDLAVANPPDGVRPDPLLRIMNSNGKALSVKAPSEAIDVVSQQLREMMV